MACVGNYLTSMPRPVLDREHFTVYMSKAALGRWKRGLSINEGRQGTTSIADPALTQPFFILIPGCSVCSEESLIHILDNGMDLLPDISVDWQSARIDFCLTSLEAAFEIASHV